MAPLVLVSEVSQAASAGGYDATIDFAFLRPIGTLAVIVTVWVVLILILWLGRRPRT